jgi:ABC-type nickel/cobalt efflux system permease component RcnA
MSRLGQRTLAFPLAAAALLAITPSAAAHPLGNATVSRAVAVTIAPDGIGVDYVIDMAEIPAFAAIGEIDTDDDGSLSAGESAAWGSVTCADAIAGLIIEVDGHGLRLAAGSGLDLTFPPGVGGLETLRLVCRSLAPVALDASTHSLSLRDDANDGRPGWREITIKSGEGVAIVGADVPSESPSAMLTAYPEDLFAAPIDVRRGTAWFRMDGASVASSEPPAVTPGEPLVHDPLATLLAHAAGPRTGALGLVLAFLISAGLGAAHALSPGHGKALVAGSLLAGRGTARQAVALGATVAVSHTAGVLAIGGVVLVAGEVLAPDRLLAWLAIGAGGCVVLVGAGLVLRAARSMPGGSVHGRDHAHGHPHDADHAQPHYGPDHAHPHHEPKGLSGRSVMALGLFGGLVPSTSAIIVLLLAATTGQLVLGVSMIAAFGFGMAAVLAGMAWAAVWLGSRALERVVARSSVIARIGRFVPLVSGLAVLVAGTITTIGALAQVL